MTIFNFDEHQLRTLIDTQNRVWFHVTDLCKILEISNPSRMVATKINKYCSEFASGGDGRPAFYTLEPGMYKLIFQSKSIKAEEFQNTVFEEILPSIRKDGLYIEESRFDIDEVKQLKEIIAQRDNRLNNILKPAKKLIDGYDYEFQQKRHMLVFGFFDTMHPIKHRTFAQVFSEIGRYGFVYDKDRFSIALELYRERCNQEVKDNGQHYEMSKIKITDSTDIIYPENLDMFFECLYDSMREDGEIENIGTTSNMNKFQDIFGVKCGKHAEKDWSKHNNNFEHVKDLRESLEIE